MFQKTLQRRISKALRMQKPLRAFPDQDHDAHMQCTWSIYVDKNGTDESTSLRSSASTHLRARCSMKAQGEVGAIDCSRSTNDCKLNYKRIQQGVQVQIAFNGCTESI
jgi:hypothetical protein